MSAIFINGTQVVMPILPQYPNYVVDFDNPQRNGNIATYWLCGIGIPWAFAMFCSRLYVKGVIRKSLGLDDLCLVVAWLFTIAIQALILRSFILKYIGVHAFEMPIAQFGIFVKFGVYLNAIVYSVPTALAKQVILLFYSNLGNQSQWFKYSVWFTMFVNMGSNLGIFWSAIFACTPVRLGWDFTLVAGVDGTCINRVALFEATAAIAVIVDVMIILIPIPMIVNLQMSRKKKIGLLITFTIGSATVITSIIRFVLLITSLGEVDQTWGGGPISAWICVEANLLIICACLPTLRAFVRAVAPGLVSSLGGTSKNKSNAIGGTSRSRSKSNPLQNSNIPAVPNQRSYERFDNERDVDPEYGMETLVEGRSQGHTKNVVSVSSQELGGRNGDVSWISDGDSARAIVETRTTAVTYSNK